MTLEPGDVILTGTPAGARPVEARRRGRGRGRGRRTDPQPDRRGRRRDRALRRAAARRARRREQPRSAVNGARVVTLSAAGAEALAHRLHRDADRTARFAAESATRASPDSPRPGRTCGCSATRTRLRYLPLREDVRDGDRAELNAQKRAVESIGRDEVLVIDARQEPGAGTIGDILAARALARGAAGIVTDGGLRDTAAVAALELPGIYQSRASSTCSGSSTSGSRSNIPVACGGALVIPGDVIVGDDDGVLVVPAALAEQVAFDALAQESPGGMGARARPGGRVGPRDLPAQRGPPRGVRGVAGGAQRSRAVIDAGGAPLTSFGSSSIRGAITPLVTPFTADGALDLETVAALVDWQLVAGSHGISVGGSTGEPTSQTVAERIEVMRAAAAAIDGRVPFLPGTGTARIDETLELTAEAQRLGAAGALVVCPYYARPQQEGLYAWYSRVASEFPDLPIIVYNVPDPLGGRHRAGDRRSAAARTLEHRRDQGDDARLRARLARAERVRHATSSRCRGSSCSATRCSCSAGAGTSAASRTSPRSRSPSSTTPSSPAITSAPGRSTTSSMRSSTPPSSRSTRSRRNGSCTGSASCRTRPSGRRWRR